MRDNLRFVSPHADDAALLHAMVLAGLGDFAQADGLDKPVGASASALSRGERLRIALARAILQDPAVLILDVRVGIIDGGFASVPAGALHASAAFVDGGNGAIRCISPGTPPLPHGERVAALVLEPAPEARLIDARVASHAERPTARGVAAALDWCVAEGARVVNLSLGLADDRAVLRAACARAVGFGVLLVAAAPARGAPVFPACYPDVFAVSGDARCGPGEWSLLDRDAKAGAAYGASPDAPLGGPGGASMAAARITGLVAAFLARRPDAGCHVLVEHLAAFASWRGRENRRIAEIDS